MWAKNAQDNVVEISKSADETANGMSLLVATKLDYLILHFQLRLLSLENVISALSVRQ